MSRGSLIFTLLALVDGGITAATVAHYGWDRMSVIWLCVASTAAILAGVFK